MIDESPMIEHRSLPLFRLVENYIRSQILSTNFESIIEISRCIRTNDYPIGMIIRNLTTYE